MGKKWAQKKKKKFILNFIIKISQGGDKWDSKNNWKVK